MTSCWQARFERSSGTENILSTWDHTKAVDVVKFDSTKCTQDYHWLAVPLEGPFLRYGKVDNFDFQEGFTIRARRKDLYH